MRFAILICQPLVGSYLVGIRLNSLYPSTGADGLPRVWAWSHVLLAYCNTAKCCTTRRCDIKAKGGEIDRFGFWAHSKRASALLQRWRCALYWLRYRDRSIFRTSLSIARFSRDRYSRVGVTSRQQVERPTDFRAWRRRGLFHVQGPSGHAALRSGFALANSSRDTGP
jgi:hypothetical protein